MNTPHIPTLTEPGVSYFLRSTLKKCNETKTKYFNVLWNLGLLFFFVATFRDNLSLQKKYQINCR